MNLGEAAHITAASPGGPRYDSSLTSEQRQHASNGVWLCRIHAKAVDADEKQFSVEALRKWKEEAIKKSFDDLMRGQRGQSAQPATINAVSTQAQAIEATRADIATFKQGGRWPKHAIQLNLHLLNEKNTEIFNAASLAAISSTFNELVLVANPGTGKSTSLIQIVEATITINQTPSIYIPLNEWSATNRPFLEYAMTRPTLSSLKRSDLESLATEGRLLLALDGWNELDEESRKLATVQIKEFARTFPCARLLISTRRQALSVPIHGPIVEIATLSEQQQLEIVRAIRPKDGEKLLDAAWRTSGLRELVAIPLYLNTLLQQAQGDKLPRTKEEVLRLFVAEHQRLPENAEVLRKVLEDRHDDILTALAVEATRRTTTIIAEDRARSVVAAVQKDLVNAGQIGTAQTPAKILDILVSHHSLVRVSSGGPISFQHQQIQEWYASREVERIIMSAYTGDVEARKTLAMDILDNRDWEEAIFFAIERLSSQQGDPAKAVANAIIRAMEIDPILAAEMIFRAGDEVWRQVAEQIQDYVKRWHTPAQVDRAVGFMIRTGRPEFAAPIRLLLANTDTQVSLPALRAAPRFRSSVLGSDVAKWLVGLPEEVRATIISELAYHGNIESLELAAKLAAEDNSADVQYRTVEGLAFRLADRLVAQVLQQAPDQVWKSVAKKGFPEHSNVPEIEARLAKERRAYAAAASDPIAKLGQILHQDGKPDPAEIIGLIASKDFPPRDQRASHILSELNKRFPNAVAGGLSERVKAGVELPFRSEELLRASNQEYEEGPIVDAIYKPAISSRDTLANAALIGPRTIAKLIDERLALDTQVRAPGSQRDQGVQNRYNQVLDLITSTKPDAFANAIIARSAERDPNTIEQLTSFMARHFGGDTKEKNLPEASLTAKLSALLAVWGDALLNDSSSTRRQFQSLASAIGRLGDPKLIPLLDRLLTADLGGIERDRAQGNVMSYDNIYSGAFSAIGTDEAAKAMIRHLSDPSFGAKAAIVLKEIWDHEHGVARNVMERWPNFSSAASKQRQRQEKEKESEDSPYAAEIFKIVAQLLQKEMSDKELALALSLAGTGILLPHVERATEIGALLAYKKSHRNKLRLLMALVAEGYIISADFVLEAIKEFMEAAKTQTWLLRDGHYELEEWLSLLPMSDRPDSVMDALALLPSDSRNPRKLDRLLASLGHAPSPEAEGVLFKLGEQDANLYGHYEWLRAVEAKGTPTAVVRLLDLITAGQLTTRRGTVDLWSLSRQIAQIMQSQTEVRTAVYQRFPGMPVGPAKDLVSRAISEAPDEDGILLFLDAYAAAKKPFDGNFYSAIRNVLISEQDSSSWAGAREMVPVPIPQLRKRLFALLSKTEPHATLARSCLTAIDELRDDYGVPNSERRHPDITLGSPWPLAVR